MTITGAEYEAWNARRATKRRSLFFIGRTIQLQYQCMVGIARQIAAQELGLFFLPGSAGLVRPGHDPARPFDNRPDSSMVSEWQKRSAAHLWKSMARLAKEKPLVCMVPIEDET